MSAMTKDEGKQKMDSNPTIENKVPVEGKKKSKKIFLLGGLLVFLIIAGGGGFWAFKYFRASQGLANPKGKSAKEIQRPKVNGIIALEPFLVNLADTNEIRFIKATFQLGMEEKLKEESKGTAEIPAIRDSIISLLSAKTAEQILTIQGKEKLREEIRSRINAISHENKVAEVYIVDFVVQL
jgi:flagellar protein FliL